MRQKPTKLKKIKTRLFERWKRNSLESEGVEFNRIAQQSQIDPNGITVILNLYKRAGYLEQQIDALRQQTIPPAQIWLWCNENGSGKPMADFSDKVDRVIISNANWKFWGRFALGYLATTKYIALFDDDVLPQPRWFENCLQCIDSGHDGILGGSGVWLPPEGGYGGNTKAGWNGKQSDNIETVDLVGHAWFMRKQHLQYMWNEEPYSWDNGEDIHLSYTALKYGNIKTYVPPHPIDKPDLWSCDPQFGRIAGDDKKVATYKTTTNHSSIRDAAVRYYCENGWKIVNNQT